MIDKLKRKWKLITLISFSIILVGYLGWHLLGNKNTVTAQAATVQVRKGTIEVTVSGTGAVKPIVTKDITTNVSGTITNINFKSGQQVKKGDLLFELNSDSFQTDIKKAELDLKQAELEYSTNIKESKQQRVDAPITGQVEIIEVEEGQDIQKNSALMVINDTSKLIFKVTVNEAQMNNIQPGQKADVTIPDFFATLEGRVQKVNRVHNTRTDGAKLYDITIEIDNPGTLAPGITAQAVIHTPKGLERSFEPGTLEWIESVTVRAGISGTVEQLQVDENAYVKKGQQLAYISNDDINTQITSQDLRVQQARLNLESLRNKIADYKIYAPVDGVVTLNQDGSKSKSSNNNSSDSDSSIQTYWQVGDEVSSGQVLATIVGTTGMIVTVPVDEVDITKIKLGQKATITADALPNKTFNGTVIEIAAEGTEQNGVASFDVTVGIDQPEELKSNMTANVEIMVAKKDEALLLPIEAVQERQGRKFVIVPTDENNRGKNEGTGQTDKQLNRPGGRTDGGENRTQPLNMISVETGLYNESMIEIVSGLREGDIVTVPNATRNSSTSGRTNMGNPGGMPLFSPAGGAGRTGGGGFGSRTR